MDTLEAAPDMCGRGTETPASHPVRAKRALPRAGKRSEAERCERQQRFGDVAAGGNARIFLPVDRSQIPKLWRRKRMHKYVLPDGRRSEQLAWELEQGWHARTLEPRLLQKLDDLAARWHALAPGEALTLEWPRPEGRRRHPPRDRRRPERRR